MRKYKNLKIEHIHSLWPVNFKYTLNACKLDWEEKLSDFYVKSMLKILTGTIPESKGMGAIFSEKVQRNVRMAKSLKIWAKMYKIWEYFEKWQLILTCNNCMH